MTIRIIDSFEDEKEITHEGDLQIDCEVPEGVKINVKDGSLTINGDVGAGVNIRLEIIPASIITQSIRGSNCIIFSGNYISFSGATGIYTTTVMSSASAYKLIINGNLKQGVKIDSDVTVSCDNIDELCVIKANGAVNCKQVGANTTITTRNANISATDIGESASLITSNAGIRAENIGTNAKLITSNGSITVKNVEEHARLNTSNASITAENVATRAILSTSNGAINAAAVKDGAIIVTSNANVSVDSAEDPSCISTSNGDIYIDDRPYVRPKQQGTKRQRYQ